VLLKYRKVDKQMSVENNSRPWKTKEHHGRVRGHRKGSQLTYLDG